MRWVISAPAAPLLEREDQLALVELLLARSPRRARSARAVRGGAGHRQVASARRRVRSWRRPLASRCCVPEGASSSEISRTASSASSSRHVSHPAATRSAHASSPAQRTSPRRSSSSARPGAWLARGEDASHTTLHGLFWLTANLAELGPLAARRGRRPVVRLTLAALPLLPRPPTRRASGRSRSLRSDGRTRHRRGCPRRVRVGAARHGRSSWRRSAPTPSLNSSARGSRAIPPRSSCKRCTRLARGIRSCSTSSSTPYSRHRSSRPRARPHVSASSGRSRSLASSLQRLRRLGPGAEALACAVAILGEERDLQLVSALAGLDPKSAAVSAAELARSDVLRPRGPLAFAHPILRTAVYADLSEAERERGHERAAELLGDRGAPAQRVAAHLLNVPPRARASVVATLREAARRASDEGAADVARSYLERALAEPPDAHQRADVVFELGSAELRSGLPGALGHLREAHELVRGEPPSAEVALALANAYFAEDVDLFEAADGLQRTIEGLDPSDAALTQRLEAELIMWARFDARLYPMARERLARIADRATEDSLGGRFLMVLVASELARNRRIARPGAGARAARSRRRPPSRWRELPGIHGGGRGAHEPGRARYRCALVHGVARARPQAGLGLRVRACVVVPCLCAASPRRLVGGRSRRQSGPGRRFSARFHLRAPGRGARRAWRTRRGDSDARPRRHAGGSSHVADSAITRPSRAASHR